MKAKLLVFFGIVAIGVTISLLTLTKCHKTEGGGGSGEIASVEKGGDIDLSPSTPPPASPVTPKADSEVASAPVTPVPVEVKPMVNATEKTTSVGTPPAPEVKPTIPTTTAPAMATQFKEGTNTPDAVVGGLANLAVKKDFQEFMAAAGDAIPAEIKEKLKAIVEDPNLKLNPDRPFWEVAKTRDSVRWMLDFVPTKEGGALAQSVIMDIAKVGDDQYKISGVSLPPTVTDVVKATHGPKADEEAKFDSLTVAQAFTNAVTSEDFVSARKLCSEKVTDERIAGLMIALEEGKFTMREDRPLVVTFTRDAVSWVLSRVSSPTHSSEFAVELENTGTWKVAGLTFGKVIAAIASEVEGPYSPLVEDPAGGESLVVYFDFDDSGLSSRADSQLKIVANILKADRNRRIRITGHADALGTDQYNVQLSSNRADAIRRGIIERGAAPEQVITEGYGATKPRKPNFKEDGTDNPDGRSENRRAEVYLDF